MPNDVVHDGSFSVTWIVHVEQQHNKESVFRCAVLIRNEGSEFRYRIVHEEHFRPITLFMDRFGTGF